MFRVDLRHITHRIGFRDFAEELSDLAAVTVEQASALCHLSLQGRYGAPSLSSGDPCPWTACALGKFGGRELGFGSDIEMLFVYQEEGSTRGPQVVRTSTYFNDFVRAFLAALETRREGIFELDLRLRPYGNKGALASSLAAFMEYYSGDGFARQFERMALVRLRPVAGDPALGAQVLEARDAFVYFGAPLEMENIRHLRGRQASELVPAGQVSAKYSSGGLVDVEYYVQARQIAVGHSDPSVRVANTLDAIDRLVHEGHIPQGQAEELRETYGFLRRLIDALRIVRGHAKDLTIPPTETREFAYLAHRLQYPSPAALRGAISERMGYAKGVWEGMR
jgi:glutamate-ammonia-ligase adenylyltransferase